MVSTKSTLIAKNTGFLFIRMILVVLIGLYTSRVVLKTLGVSDFGIYNLVGTLVVMFSFFKTALTNATSRFITFDLGVGNRNNLNKTFSMSLNIHVILSIIIFILSEIVGPWFISTKLNVSPNRIIAAQYVFQFSLLSFVIEILKTPYNSTVIAHERMNFYALTSIVEVSLKLLIVLLLICFSIDKLILYSILLSLVSLLLCLWMVFYCLIHFDECKYKYYWDGSLFKKLINYSGLSIIVNFADVSVAQSIGIFFNIFNGVTANAALGIANQVNGQLNAFLSNFSQSYSPQIIKSYAEGNTDYFLRLIYSTSKISYFLYFLVAFPIVINIKLILNIWLFNPPKLAAPFLCCIVLFSLFDSFSIPLWTSVHATGKIKTHQLLMSSIKILNIPLSYIVLKLGYPLISVLIIYALLNLVCAIVRIIYLHYLINLDLLYYFKDVICKILLVSMLSSIIPIFIVIHYHNAILNFFLTTISFSIIFIFCLYSFGLNINEKEIIKSLVNNFCSKLKR